MIRPTDPLLNRSHLRQFLQASRHALRMSQAQLAATLGVSLARVKRWESFYDGRDIPPWVFWAMTGLLLDRGKLVQVITDFVPRATIPKNRFSDRTAAPKWRRNLRTAQ